MPFFNKSTWLLINSIIKRLISDINKKYAEKYEQFKKDTQTETPTSKQTSGFVSL